MEKQFVRSEIKAEDGGVVSEEAFYDEYGKLVGYWAYGYFDPSLPYQGDTEERGKSSDYCPASESRPASK